MKQYRVLAVLPATYYVSISFWLLLPSVSALLLCRLSGRSFSNVMGGVALGLATGALFFLGFLISHIRAYRTLTATNAGLVKRTPGINQYFGAIEVRLVRWEQLETCKTILITYPWNKSKLHDAVELTLTKSGKTSDPVNECRASLKILVGDVPVIWTNSGKDFLAFCRQSEGYIEWRRDFLR